MNEPAFTHDEWVGVRANIDSIPVENRHGMAAACLYEQPFGFTHEDARAHRWQASTCRNKARGFPDGMEMWTHDADWHESMADRIEALLPPVLMRVV